MSRHFDLYTVLSVTHGLPVTGPPYKDILEYLTGLSLPSPLAALPHREPCAAWLLEQHPVLRTLSMPAFGDGDELAMDRWADECKAAIGAHELPVAPLPPGRVVDQPIIETLADLGAAEKTYVVDPGAAD